VFHARNIAAGTNTVQADFATAITSWADMYIHEYSGIDKADPVDVSAVATGTTPAMNSGSATTTKANDLIFGAVASSGNVNQTGTGFTSRSSSFGNRTEDKNVTSTGAYSATARQNDNAWVMHMVAFKADPGDTTPPSTHDDPERAGAEAAVGPREREVSRACGTLGCCDGPATHSARTSPRENRRHPAGQQG
jgi:hypothetical protein